MSGPLKINGATIRASSSALIDAGSHVPKSAPLNLADCGSAAVAAAAERFNERSKKFAALAALQLTDIGNDARRAADAWDKQEAALAASAGATP